MHNYFVKVAVLNSEVAGIMSHGGICLSSSIVGAAAIRRITAFPDDPQWLMATRSDVNALRILQAPVGVVLGACHIQTLP
jgi:hypothetical protein